MSAPTAAGVTRGAPPRRRRGGPLRDFGGAEPRRSRALRIPPRLHSRGFLRRRGEGVLAICHQMGGARAVAPVIHRLRHDGIRVVAVGEGLGAAGLDEAGVSVRPPTGYAGAAFPRSEVANAILHQERPAVVLSGTSTGDTLERALTSQAQQAGVPTVAVLDHWCNYAARFQGPTGPWHYLPDRLAVMDATASHALVRLGCPPERLVVTGQPALDALMDGEPLAGRDETRRRWGVGEEAWVLVFASDAVSWEYGTRLGYTEVEVLELVLEALHNLPVRVVVKLHPCETPEALQPTLARAPLPIFLERELSPHRVLAGADTVVGMTSIFLLEAVLAGRPVLSIQPGHLMEWTQHFSRVMTIVQEADHIRRWVSDSAHRRCLNREERLACQRAAGFPGQAIQNVVELISRMLTGTV